MKKKEMKKKNINFNIPEESKIIKLSDLNINKSTSLPVVIINNSNNGNFAANRIQSNIVNEQEELKPKLVTKGAKGLYDYSGYKNPNIVKEKAKFKTKTNEIINKIKNNELSQLKLNVLNDIYKNSKVVYVDKKSINKNQHNFKDVVIMFDAKKLNKSQSNSSLNLSGDDAVNKSISFHNNKNNSFHNIKERELDHKINKLKLNKT